MKGLSKTWLTDPWIDAEYKMYLLMAYLQEVGLSFEQRKLYPQLSELIEHYREVKRLKESTDYLQENFPGELRGIDLTHLQLNYQRLADDDQLFAELMATVNFSLPQMEAYIRKGKELYEYVEKNISVEPVGVVPLDTREGYFFLGNKTSCTADVYAYHISIFEHAEDKYRSLQTRYLQSYPISLMHTYAYIKSDLIRQRKDLPNPATYAVETDMELPVQECLLPVAKRVLMRHIAAA